MTEAPASGELSWLLRNLGARVGHVRQAVVLSADGLTMGTSQGLSLDDADHLSALAAGVQSLARGASRRFRGGDVRPQDDGWMDEDAGPVARPYMVTGGRTRPVGERDFDLIDIVMATGAEPRRAFSPGPEHWRILSLCQRPLVVAELAAALGLPLGVVHVLLGDLLYEDLVSVSRQAQRVTDRGLLQKVLNGLYAL